MKKIFGLLLLTAMSFGHVASFPCTQAQTSTEKAICNTRSLNDADVKLVTVYNIVLHAVPMGGRDDEKSAQYQWLKKRNACGADVVCIGGAYAVRQQHLDRIINNRVLTQGPF